MNIKTIKNMKINPIKGIALVLSLALAGSTAMQAAELSQLSSSWEEEYTDRGEVVGTHSTSEEISGISANLPPRPKGHPSSEDEGSWIVLPAMNAASVAASDTVIISTAPTILIMHTPPPVAQPREPLLQGINLSTNLLLWGVGSINIGAQLPFADRWHLGVDAAWGGWAMDGDTRGIRLSTIGVEVRRYFKPDANTDQHGFARRMRMDRGFFLGIDARTTHFNYRPKDTGKEGNLVSIGLTAGYSWNFAYNWGIDLAIGAGYRYADYDRYYYYIPMQENVWTGNCRKNSFGITRAEVSFVYRFEL